MKSEGIKSGFRRPPLQKFGNFPAIGHLSAKFAQLDRRCGKQQVIHWCRVGKGLSVFNSLIHRIGDKADIVPDGVKLPQQFPVGGRYQRKVNRIKLAFDVADVMLAPVGVRVDAVDIPLQDFDARYFVADFQKRFRRYDVGMPEYNGVGTEIQAVMVKIVIGFAHAPRRFGAEQRKGTRRFPVVIATV